MSSEAEWFWVVSLVARLAPTDREKMQRAVRLARSLYPVIAEEGVSPPVSGGFPFAPAARGSRRPKEDPISEPVNLPYQQSNQPPSREVQLSILNGDIVRLRRMLAVSPNLMLQKHLVMALQALSDLAPSAALDQAIRAEVDKVLVMEMAAAEA